MTTRDWPDYNALEGAIEICPIVDLGEVIARLGAPAVWDRRGNAVGVYIFDGSYRGFIRGTSGPTGTSVLLGTDYAEFFNTDIVFTLAADPSAYAFIQRDFAVRYGGRLGVETAVLWPNEGPDIDLYSRIFGPTLNYQGAIRIDTNLDLIYYLDAAGAWVALSPAPTGMFAEEVWYPAKLVIDGATGRYVRFSFGADVWEFNALMSPALSSMQAWRVQVYARNKYAAERKAYVGYVVLTVNEP